MKNLNASLQQITSTLEEVEQFRLKKLEESRKRWYWLLIPLGILLLSIWGYIIGTEGANIVANFGLMIALGLATYIYFDAIRGSIKDYKLKFKKLALTELTKTLHPTINYIPTKSIDKLTFLDSYLFREKEIHYRGQDLFEGTFKNSKLSFSELNVRTAGENSTEIFKGLFFVIETTQKLAKQLSILPKNAAIYFKDLSESKALKKKVSQIIIEERKVAMSAHPQFDQLFKVYTVDPEDGHQLLSSAMCSAIIALQNKLKTDIYLSFIDQKVYIAIRNAEDYFEIDPKESVLENSTFLKLYEELTLCFDVVELLTTRINNFE